MQLTHPINEKTTRKKHACGDESKLERFVFYEPSLSPGGALSFIKSIEYLTCIYYRASFQDRIRSINS